MPNLKSPVVILAAGDYPTHPVPLRTLEEAGTVVCLDSAADTYSARTGELPHFVVGDGDSISPILRERLADRFIREAEQNTNDLCKAVRFLATCGVDETVILGATGRREDHTIGNIFHLPDLSRLLHITMVTDYGIFHVPDANGILAISTQIGTQVSIFNCGARNLCATGLRWPLTDFTELWQGTLNEATDSSINFKGCGDYLVYVTHSTE